MEVFEHSAVRHDCFLLEKPQTNQMFFDVNDSTKVSSNTGNQ